MPVDNIYSNHLRMTNLVKVDFMLKVFNVLEIVLWCSKCFNTTIRVIHVGESTMPLIILSPIIFLANAKDS